MFISRLLIVIASGCLLAACEKSNAPSAEPAQTGASQPSPGVSASPSAEPFSVARVFPPGEGRELVLNTCASCHPAVCVARGQRTAERWESIKEGHKDRLTSNSDADINVMFSYLKENFNDAKPEPQIPAEILQACTQVI